AAVDQPGRLQYPDGGAGQRRSRRGGALRRRQRDGADPARRRACGPGAHHRRHRRPPRPRQSRRGYLPCAGPGRLGRRQPLPDGRRRGDRAQPQSPPGEDGMTRGTEAAWQALGAELAAWQEAGRVAGIWWRDDDAVAPGAALDRLLDLATRHQAGLALAVIPAQAEPALARRLAEHPARTAVLQHGYAHTDHAPDGAKKCELVAPATRPAILEELARGRDRLGALFGDRLLPVMVPPWNRID